MNQKGTSKYKQKHMHHKKQKQFSILKQEHAVSLLRSSHPEEFFRCHKAHRKYSRMPLLTLFTTGITQKEYQIKEN